MLEIGFNDLKEWMRQDGVVGVRCFLFVSFSTHALLQILDATNSTRDRRQFIIDQCKANGFDVAPHLVVVLFLFG
jgi:hypothetical protein